MAERPILFSAPMILAILAGAKTQTRRNVNPTGRIVAMSWPPLHPERGLRVTVRTGPRSTHTGPIGDHLDACPYGQPGDRLWVREKHRVTGWDEGGYVRVEYAADGADRLVATRMNDYDDWVYRRCEIWERAGAKADVESGLMAPPPGGIPWTPSIHMPRWASRITLEVTSVRVERLHEISDDDARAEGAPGPFDSLFTPRLRFERLWESINGPESWDANPWVWVVSFRKLEVARG